MRYIKRDREKNERRATGKREDKMKTEKVARIGEIKHLDAVSFCNK